jgi:hypothetical protein
MKTISAKAKYSERARNLLTDKGSSRDLFAKILLANKLGAQDQKIVVNGYTVVTERKR